MGSEQREFRRADLAVPIRFRPSSALMELWQSGTLLDLSAGGFRFSTDQPIEVGTELDFQVHLPIRKDPHVFIGLVRWEKPSGGIWEYGVTFGNVTMDQQVDIDRLVAFLTQKRA